MREIKFRGKRKDNGQFVYGYVWKNLGGTFIQSHEGNVYGGIHEVDPETVGQYIGIKDGLTDEEWCEGDILTPNTHAKNQELQIICYDIHQGRYKGVPSSAYELNAGNGGWTGFDIKSWQKRIGNIHDNSELLAPKEGADTE